MSDRPLYDMDPAEMSRHQLRQLYDVHSSDLADFRARIEANVVDFNAEQSRKANEIDAQIRIHTRKVEENDYIRSLLYPKPVEPTVEYVLDRPSWWERIFGKKEKNDA